jgi:Cu-Zn family superoxide dismutase
MREGDAMRYPQSLTMAFVASAFLAGALAGASARAEEASVEMHLITAQGIGQSLGTLTTMDSANGLVVKLDLAAELSPGAHGFHVHQNGACEAMEKDGAMVAGLAAGGHFDPGDTGKHLGPSGEGHLGDLPVLYVGVDENGALPVTHALVAPRLTLADIRGKAIVIHAAGDNFRDTPKPLGGGGARVACGLVPE